LVGAVGAIDGDDGGDSFSPFPVFSAFIWGLIVPGECPLGALREDLLGGVAGKCRISAGWTRAVFAELPRSNLIYVS
jgi:hypothetical protein